MPKVPDYREIEVPISISNIKDQVSALLYAAGYVHDDEDIIDLIFPEAGMEDTHIMIKIKIKKNRPVEVIEH